MTYLEQVSSPNYLIESQERLADLNHTLDLIERAKVYGWVSKKDLAWKTTETMRMIIEERGIIFRKASYSMKRDEDLSLVLGDHSFYFAKDNAAHLRR